MDNQKLAKHITNNWVIVCLYLKLIIELLHLIFSFILCAVHGVKWNLLGISCFICVALTVFKLAEATKCVKKQQQINKKENRRKNEHDP